MAFLRQWLLILSVLILGGGQLFAASGAKAEHAYVAAVTAFQDEMWSRAEMEFAQFVKQFPDSTNVPEARLFQAQAACQQQDFTNAIGLLTTNLPSAGSLADQYVYWIGEAHFLAGAYSAAVTTFDSLGQKYPQSPLRLRAAVEAAAAQAKLGDWSQLVASLQATNGVFQQARQAGYVGDLVSRGELLLAQARFAQKDFNAASAILEAVNPQTFAPALDWQRIYLLCQIKLAAGDTTAALAASTNLLAAAQLDRSADAAAHLAASVAMQATALEQSGRPAEALAVYQKNLTNAPPAMQEQAILKIAALASSLNQFADATNALGNFLTQFSNSPAADRALLALGELQLKEYAATRPAGTATNLLPAATACFNQFIGTFTNSPLLGKAYLDRGWCDWLAGKIPESYNDFKTAAQQFARLPGTPPADLPVAWFKMGDTLLRQKDYAGALENYRAVLDSFKFSPAGSPALHERALYQSLRAELALHDERGANETLARILRNFPAGDLSDNAILLVAEDAADTSSPEAARTLLKQFETQFPDSELLPEARLAFARTYELENNWPAAITNYTRWLVDFSTNSLRPQATYALALANYHAGNETNALRQFTNFVAQFPANSLAPSAQWWVADHFFRAGDFVNAERNYKAIFQNADWRNSPLFWEAQMMAGRVAMARGGYPDAITYFTGLAGDTNCPPALNAAARFAYGTVLMLQNSPDTNNPVANFQAATNVFSQLAQSDATNVWGLRALIETGDCDLQMNNFTDATNAYAQAFESPYAAVFLRSQAQVGMGVALEKMAATLTDTNQAAMLNLALNNYWDVFTRKNLRDGETADDFWVKKAGLQAAPLIGLLNNAEAERKFYGSLKTLLPPMAEIIDKKLAALPPPKN
jgi:TolA-binding protein